MSLVSGSKQHQGVKRTSILHHVKDEHWCHPTRSKKSRLWPERAPQNGVRQLISNLKVESAMQNPGLLLSSWEELVFLVFLTGETPRNHGFLYELWFCCLVVQKLNHQALRVLICADIPSLSGFALYDYWNKSPAKIDFAQILQR